MPWIQIVAALLLAMGTAALFAFLRLAERLDAEERPEMAGSRVAHAVGATRAAPRRAVVAPATCDHGASASGASYPRAA